MSPDVACLVQLQRFRPCVFCKVPTITSNRLLQSLAEVSPLFILNFSFIGLNFEYVSFFRMWQSVSEWSWEWEFINHLVNRLLQSLAHIYIANNANTILVSHLLHLLLIFSNLGGFMGNLSLITLPYQCSLIDNFRPWSYQHECAYYS